GAFEFASGRAWRDHQRANPFRRPRCKAREALRARPSWPGAGARRPPLLSLVDRRGESDHRRVGPKFEPPRGGGGSRTGLCLLSPLEGKAKGKIGPHVRWRTANDGDRPRADVAAAAPRPR